MGLEPELELSELAVLRTIRTTAVSSAGAATTRPSNDGQDAANTGGCVTPTAISPMPRRGGVEDDTGCVTPTPISSMPRQGGVDVDTGCVTPTSAASILRPATVCPPAPRKPARAPAKRKRCGRPAPRRCFFPVPHDLGTVFVPRGAAASSPSSPAAKKIRMHAVG
ncbi:uncharacterized protein LOC133925981 [Phragmites australis]|uniref:uncharacterized protein LOC133925981 n=1 Tax=Phragmites australis TaxID=29695 RepID=UPI002D7735C3|nr:uncharacterized protein LOC133925981 [Phragmites australis]